MHAVDLADPSDARAEAAARDLAHIPVAEALAALGVDPANGLSAAEVEARHKLHGYNEVAPERAHPVRAFLGKFWGLSAWLLELIMILSLWLGKYSDCAMVGALLIVNAAVGFAQERRAAGAVEALRRQLQVSARVRRSSTWQVSPARELVPGDIVRLRSGDIVPADIRLLAGTLSADQSALTGESREVAKAAGDMLSSGSIVRRGEGDGVVLLTGGRTYFGRTTELVQQARPKLHIEAVIARLVRWMFTIVGVLLAGVAALVLIRGSLAAIAPLLLVLLMSAVPVALPVMFTVSMAVGARELARRGVLVTRLGAAEDAATMNMLCIDKTGTITENRLTVDRAIPLDGAREDEVLEAGAWASQEADQDPIDLAFLAAARQRGASEAGDVVRVSFVPFDAQRRRTEAVVERAGRRIRVMKGAVRTLAEVCGLDPAAVARLDAMAADASSRGFRTLAVARGPEDGVPALVGLVTLRDPPRPDAARFIATLRELGVAVKMLTGDALPVAAEIARGVGLANVRRMEDIKAAGRAGGPASVTLLAQADGYAEVFPEDKYDVVRLLQASGHVTGMTGDGVNDAPALRQAEVGIAVSTATDVAKSAASVVLTEAGLTNIVSLVEQGRIVYERILTWIVNKISVTILKAGFVALAFALTGKFVVSALPMLLLVFMTDLAKIALGTDRVRWSRKPASWNIGGLVQVSTVLGIAMVAEALLALAVAWRPGNLAGDPEALASLSFEILLYFAVFSIASSRERRWCWSSMPGRALVVALAADIVLGTALVYAGLHRFAPLPWRQTLAVLAYSAVCCLGLNDALKVWLIRWRAPAAA